MSELGLGGRVPPAIEEPKGADHTNKHNTAVEQAAFPAQGIVAFINQQQQHFHGDQDDGIIDHQGQSNLLLFQSLRSLIRFCGTVNTSDNSCLIYRFFPVSSRSLPHFALFGMILDGYFSGLRIDS